MRSIINLESSFGVQSSSFLNLPFIKGEREASPVIEHRHFEDHRLLFDILQAYYFQFRARLEATRKNLAGKCLLLESSPGKCC